MACINGGSVWDVACVFGQVRRARQIGRITGKDLKSSSSLPLHGHGRRRTMPFKTALFFFQRKENVIRKNPKIGYDSRPLFTMLTKQKNSSMFCIISFVKKRKGK
jgi:hypothetical protein